MRGKRRLNQRILYKKVFLPLVCFSLLKIPCAFSSDESSLRDIKGPIPWPDHSFFIVVAGFLLLFLAGVLLYIMARKRKTIRVPSPLPHEAAYEALEALRRRDLIRQERIQEYYEELSNIIRRYLENRFSYRASQMTKEECLLTIQTQKEFSSEQRTLLRDFLHNCDFVKFAGYRPQFEEMEKSLKTGRDIIDQTREEPVLR